jgi:hypothetical protein
MDDGHSHLAPTAANTNSHKRQASSSQAFAAPPVNCGCRCTLCELPITVHPGVGIQLRPPLRLGPVRTYVRSQRRPARLARTRRDHHQPACPVRLRRHHLMKFFPQDDLRVIVTAHAVRWELAHDGVLHRHPRLDGQEAAEGLLVTWPLPFRVCSGWCTRSRSPVALLQGHQPLGEVPRGTYDFALLTEERAPNAATTIRRGCRC